MLRKIIFKILLLSSVFQLGITENGKSFQYSSFMRMENSPSKLTFWSSKTMTSTDLEEIKKSQESTIISKVDASKTEESKINEISKLNSKIQNYENEDEIQSLNDLDNSAAEKIPDEDFIKEKQNYIQKLYGNSGKPVADIKKEENVPIQSKPSSFFLNPFNLALSLFDSLTKVKPTRDNESRQTLKIVPLTTEKSKEGEDLVTPLNSYCTCNQTPCMCNTNLQKPLLSEEYPFGSEISDRPVEMTERENFNTTPSDDIENEDMIPTTIKPHPTPSTFTIRFPTKLSTRNEDNLMKKDDIISTTLPNISKINKSDCESGKCKQEITTESSGPLESRVFPHVFLFVRKPKQYI